MRVHSLALASTAVAVLVGALACGGDESSSSGSGTGGAGAATTADGPSPPAGSTGASMACDFGLVLVHPWSGGGVPIDGGTTATDAGDGAYCVSIPANCPQWPSCSCFATDPCDGQGMCGIVTQTEVTCMCA